MIPDHPKIDFAVADEEQQMLRYMRDIVMEDLALSPPPSARRVRKGSLLEMYQNSVKERHEIDRENDVAPVEEIVAPSAGVGFVKHQVAEFVGKKSGD